MEPELAIQEFLEYVIVQLIQHPEEAGVIHEREGERHLYRIRLHPDDAGRVIGKSGKTISAIRSLAIASAQKHHLRIDVELEDSEREDRQN
ncbi:MAG: KH domain-containing protein [Verrucomicrobiota bacterium]